MSRLFAKGNNYLRQLGTGTKARELEWRESIFKTDQKIKQIEANTGQSALMLDDGKI